MTFTGYEALYGVTYPIYPADDNSPFNLICGYYGQCAGMNITCPKYSHCNISCTANFSCRAITINPPQNESLFNLTFTGDGALYGVTYPTYADDDNSTFNLTCDSYGLCYGIKIICPQYSQCNIDCISDNACAYVCYFYWMIVL